MEFGDDAIEVRMVIREANSVVRIPEKGVALEEVQRQAITQTLRMCGWCQHDAARMLHISPRVINYKMRTLGIEVERKWLRVAIAADRRRV
jgi:transcriptional regulator with GAF, ATPase, and Fis domain